MPVKTVRHSKKGYYLVTPASGESDSSPSPCMAVTSGYYSPLTYQLPTVRSKHVHNNLLKTPSKQQ
jgi:hypothetical protein